MLRHGARKLHLEMDGAGWVNLDLLLKVINEGRSEKITLDQIEHIVEHNDKRRFIIKDGKIRANQGHSIDVDLDLKPREPPRVLFHGTGKKSEARILEQGLKKMGRNHVHLSKDKETAVQVGKRHGMPVIFVVASGKMHEDGYNFYLSENGVWLVDSVPSEYLNIVNKEKKIE